MSVTCDEVFDKKPPEEILQDGQPYTRPNMHTENADVNFLHSEKRRRQRLESRRKRYREYQVYYYGTPQEQVERKSQIRAELQQQLQWNASQTERRHFAHNTEESKQMQQEASRYKQDEREHRDKWRLHMLVFRDYNKTTIELKAEQRKLERFMTQNYERELLKHNPINWNNSLW